ncbi:MAG: (Fe-S)-binding protein [Acidimicrobiales bacterium]
MGVVVIFDAEELSACVNCGLCLPHCPTYRVTGEESLSPRGRIGLMRESVTDEIDDEFVRAMDTCVQCMGCVTACPAGVRFDRLISTARGALADEHKITPRWMRTALRGLEHPKLLNASAPAIALGQRLGLVPKRLGLPPLSFRRQALEPTGDDVWLFTGCVMDAWQRDVHVDTLAVLGRAGVGAKLLSGQCCGAMHEHAGLSSDDMLQSVIDAAPDGKPVLVNAAGCGAHLKDAGHLLGSAAAGEFAGRVFDVHEYLVAHGSPLQTTSTSKPRVAVQDPCHLRNVQGCETAVRDLLAPLVELVELDDDSLCCGAGGAYSVVHPELAQDIRQRKTESILRAKPDLVVSANPGCSMFLQADGHEVVHPMTLLASLTSAT